MARILFGVLFVLAGMLHFVKPGMYVKIMPPMVPAPWMMVYLSGVAEILGGVGVLVPVTRQAAAWGLVALLVCVWPANFYMAMRPELFPGIPVWALWVRVPMQMPMIWWAWMYTRG
ncbi:Uncharacterized membrane protein [Granulicella pectinivorans]|uniref:Uncharacterized membrane protein n=1 Tax=Granulicella pectinivorans TaxID=474950 RepID=A0A1I6N0I0_9BACT|nr:DoxX family membrane protein [Granulicella pectinivorans]SFS21450.1 Uncharacterized membrane protein [Granulicella pectinivorans]